jgi:hypothetical protein
MPTAPHSGLKIRSGREWLDLFAWRGKIYGRLFIDIYADFTKNAAVDTKYALNSTGSRSLK